MTVQTSNKKHVFEESNLKRHYPRSPFLKNSKLVFFKKHAIRVTKFQKLNDYLRNFSFY